MEFGFRLAFACGFAWAWACDEGGERYWDAARIKRKGNKGKVSVGRECGKGMDAVYTRRRGDGKHGKKIQKEKRKQTHQLEVGTRAHAQARASGKTRLGRTKEGRTIVRRERTKDERRCEGRMYEK